MYLPHSEEIEKIESIKNKWWDSHRVDLRFCNYPGKYVMHFYGKNPGDKIDFRFWTKNYENEHCYQIFNSASDCNNPLIKNQADYDLVISKLLNQAIEFAELHEAETLRIFITDPRMLESVFLKDFKEIYSQGTDSFTAVRSITPCT